MQPHLREDSPKAGCSFKWFNCQGNPWQWSPMSKSVIANSKVLPFSICKQPPPFNLNLAGGTDIDEWYRGIKRPVVSVELSPASVLVELYCCNTQLWHVRNSQLFSLLDFITEHMSCLTLHVLFHPSMQAEGVALSLICSLTEQRLKGPN